MPSLFCRFILWCGPFLLFFQHSINQDQRVRVSLLVVLLHRHRTATRHGRGSSSDLLQVNVRVVGLHKCECNICSADELLSHKSPDGLAFTELFQQSWQTFRMFV